MVTNWPMVELRDVLEYEQPTKYIVKSINYNDDYSTPVLTAGKSFILGNTSEKEGIFRENLPVIIFDDFTTAIKFVDFPFKVKSSAMKILHADKKRADIKFLFYLMRTVKFEVNQHKRYWISKYSKIKIHLPPLLEQKRIVARIEKLMGKIEEAKKLRQEAIEETDQIIPSALHQIFSRAEKEGWKRKKIGEFVQFNYGKGIPKSERSADGKYPIYGANGILGNTNKYLIEGKGLIIGRKGSAGLITKVSGRFWPSDVTYYVLDNDEANSNFLYYLFQYIDLPFYAKGIKPGINRNEIYEIETFLPPLSEQKKIVGYLDSLSEKVKELKKLQLETAADLDALSASILRQAFEGEL